MNAEKYLSDGGGRRQMTLREKTGLMGLIREVVSGGGEIEEREEVMRGIEGVISEGRERGDSEGILAEEEGERLLWVIEKKSLGREMKNRREIERMREEAERREGEEKRKKADETKKREEAERENNQMKRKTEEETKKREEAERREIQEKNRKQELEVEIQQLKRGIDDRVSLVTTLAKTTVKIPNDAVTVQDGNQFYLRSEANQTITVGKKKSRV